MILAIYGEKEKEKFIGSTNIPAGPYLAAVEITDRFRVFCDDDASTPLLRNTLD